MWKNVYLTVKELERVVNKMIQKKVSEETIEELIRSTNVVDEEFEEKSWETPWAEPTWDKHFKMDGFIVFGNYQPEPDGPFYTFDLTCVSMETLREYTGAEDTSKYTYDDVRLPGYC
jgi:hypothetical protein